MDLSINDEQNIIDNLNDSNKINATISEKIKLLYKLTDLINKNISIDSNMKLHELLKDNINFEFPQKIKIDLNIISPAQNYYGGLSRTIYIPINTLWNDNENKLVIVDPKNEILMTFNTELSDITSIPLLASGTHTAVYEINKFDNIKKTIKKNIKYILRCYTANKNFIHMCDDKKIIKEYEKYEKYLIKIYYYGNIKLNNKIYDVKHPWDYIITKKYNTDYRLLSNKQKFIYLKNIVKILDEFILKNLYWADLKIANVGWEYNNEMNPILIDYDMNTILNVNQKNDTTSTYKPSYKLSVGLEKNNYDKFSIGGLWDIISNLNIKFNKNNYIYNDTKIFPNITINVDTTSTFNFLKSLNIKGYQYDNPPKESEYLNYDNIPTYDIILKILNSLESNNYISD